MAEQKHFIDYVDPSFGDTGEDITDSIQPVSDAEKANQTVFRRPSENLRHRSEEVREQLRELTYYRDFNHLAIKGATSGTIEWGGTVANGGTGQITQSGEITITPFLAPESNQKGTLTVGSAGTDAVIYTVDSAAYATEGLDRVLVEHRDGGAGTSLSVSITEGPVKRILVLFDSTNTSHDAAAVKSALDSAIGADAILAGNLNITTSAVAGDTVAAQSEIRIEGTADAEEHTLPDGLLTTFTGSNPLSEGHCVAIWYRYLVEPASGDPSDPKGGVPGGRWESNASRSSATLTTASLFITDNDPDKIPGAVPLCRVLNDELVFIDGSRFAPGIPAAVGSTTTVAIDDSNFAGANTLANNGGISNPLSPSTVQTALDEVDDRLAQLRAYTYTCTDGVASTGGDFEGSAAITNAAAALTSSGGIILVRRGSYTGSGGLLLPDNVKLIGESTAAVTLTIDSAGTLTIGDHSEVSNLSIVGATSGETVKVAGVRGGVSNCDLSGVTITLEGHYGFLKTSTCGDGNVDCHDYAYIEQCDSLGIVTLRDSGISIRSSTMTAIKSGIASSPVYATIDSCVIGTISDIRVVDLRNSTNMLFSSCEIYNTGAGVSVPVIEIDTASTEVSASRFVNCSIHMGDIPSGGAMVYVANTAEEGVIFEGCKFTTSDSSGTLVEQSGGSLYINNCLLDDNQATAVALINADPSGEGDSLHVRDCTLISGVSDSTTNAVRISSEAVSHFQGCEFKFSMSSGTFSGKETGRSAPLIRLEPVIGTGRFTSTLKDCVFDCADQEMEIATSTSGDPEWGGLYGYILHCHAMSVDNCKIINLNRHVNFTASGRVATFRDSHVKNLAFECTGTAASGGGTSAFTEVFTLWGETTLTHSEFVSSNGTPTQAYLVLMSQISTDPVRITDCIFRGGVLEPISYVSGTSLLSLVLLDNLIETNTAVRLPDEVSSGPHFQQVIIANNVLRILIPGGIGVGVPVFVSSGSAPPPNLVITGNSISVDSQASEPTGPFIDFTAVPSYADSTASITDNVVSWVNGTGGSVEVFPSTELPTYVVTGNIFRSDTGYVNTNWSAAGGAQVLANNVII